MGAFGAVSISGTHIFMDVLNADGTLTAPPSKKNKCFLFMIIKIFQLLLTFVYFLHLVLFCFVVSGFAFLIVIQYARAQWHTRRYALGYAPTCAEFCSCPNGCLE